MGTGEGLADGARVTVVGGIIAAVAFAAALGIAGRLRGRTFSIHVHDGEGSQASRGPVLLTPACRMHLSALGCRVPAEWCQRRFSGVELHQGERVHALPSPPAPSWWLPDSAPLRQAL
ncbi:MAG: response regulator, partial [Deltaproteobacteria bacterium]|nr:response regulator [Deltaproteobacteria bacterium]